MRRMILAAAPSSLVLALAPASALARHHSHHHKRHLYRIVHNTAISQLRRPVHDSLEASLTGLTHGADDDVERRLEARAALAGLASLPKLQREVMLSTALEGRSHDEVADALGLSHGAVRGLIYRARATLRAAAAAVIPSPLVQWAARQGAGTGRSAAVIEALAGGRSVGIGGLIVKGGAVVAAAGAIATAAGIADHGSQRRAHRDQTAESGRAGAHRRAVNGPLVATGATTTSSPSVALQEARDRTGLLAPVALTAPDRVGPAPRGRGVNPVGRCPDRVPARGPGRARGRRVGRSHVDDARLIAAGVH